MANYTWLFPTDMQDDIIHGYLTTGETPDGNGLKITVVEGFNHYTIDTTYDVSCKTSDCSAHTEFTIKANCGPSPSGDISINAPSRVDDCSNGSFTFTISSTSTSSDPLKVSFDFDSNWGLECRGISDTNLVPRTEYTIEPTSYTMHYGAVSQDTTKTIIISARQGNSSANYTVNVTCGSTPQPTEKTVKLKLHNTDATRNMHIAKVLLYLTQVEDAVIIGEGGVDHESIIIENLNLCIEPNNSTDIDIPYTATPTYKYFQNKGKNCGYSNVDKTIKIYGKSGWSECFAAPCLSGEINFSNRYDVYLTIDNYEDPSCSCS